MSELVLKVAAVLIFKDNSVLLVRHVNSKHIENIYGLPGGKIDAGEADIDAAKRELAEETGLITTAESLVRLPTLWKANVRFKDGNTRTCSMRVFLCRQYTGAVQGTEQEIPEWIPLERLPNLSILPNVREAIAEAKKML